jgi:hypothetical protein
VTRRGRSAVAVATALLAMTACYTLDEPPGGIAAISLATSPSPSVVVGDTSRDSTGAVAGVQVTAFNRNGDTIKEPPPVFLAIDRGLRVNAATGVIVGDSVVPVGARIIASVGPLQTLPDSVPVTVKPVRAWTAQTPTTLEFDSVLKVSDTAATSNQVTLTLTLSGTPPSTSKATDTMAVGFIVDWSIDAMPPGTKEAQPVATALIMDAGKESLRDTTDRQGASSRVLQVRPIYFADPDLQINGTKRDTVRVNALVRRKPARLADTTVTFFVALCLKGSAACASTP